MTALRVADVVAALEARYPPATAESWDVVGLAVGSVSAPVHGIALAVEPTAAVIEETAAAGADLLITHHPLLLRGLTAVDLDTPKGAAVAALLRGGTALYVAHAGADIAPGGVVDALAAALGVRSCRPLVPASAEPLDKLITFVPDDHVAAVIDALAAAGAGRIGRYDRCAFTAPGTGTFRPLAGAQPFLGTVGEIEEVAETRVEMALRRPDRAAVLAALHAAHPYQTPAWDLFEIADRPSGEAGLGRVGELADPVSLREFAGQVVAALPTTAAGIRIGGDPERVVRRVAVQAGAGGDLLDDARAAGADVYLTSDLRHHPATEALAWPGAPALIDVSHWAAEWTWLPELRRQLLADLGEAVPVSVSTLVADPWALRLG